MQTVIVTKPLNSDRQPAALAFESCAGASADGCSGPEISAWSLGAPYVLGGVARPVRRPPQNAGRRRASQRPADGSPGGPVACARRPKGTFWWAAEGGAWLKRNPRCMLLMVWWPWHGWHATCPATSCAISRGLVGARCSQPSRVTRCQGPPSAAADGSFGAARRRRMRFPVARAAGLLLA